MGGWGLASTYVVLLSVLQLSSVDWLQWVNFSGFVGVWRLSDIVSRGG
jgi:hypothetical protein